MGKLTEDLIRHEGLRLKPYRDTVGKLTIGIGRNLDDMGITTEEALFLLNNDITRVRTELVLAFRWFPQLSPVRRDVITNMAFNLGVPRLKRFKNMIRHIENASWTSAAKEMLDSKWAKQVGQRAVELAKMMKDGDDD